MSSPEPNSASFQRQAELVVGVFADELDITLTYDAAGIAHLATYLEQAREMLQTPLAEQAVFNLGAFLGESIRRTCGGEWREREGWWGIEIGPEVIACPFVQIQAQLREGPDQAVTRYFSCLQEIVDRLQSIEAAAAQAA
ncbi:hypothetical protein [Planctomicrobium sp. SH664]|uniref:hypothetical protein n=1 Tax=Planctomicrobium sp. SH664 TaxID=3448125 RepID=UPI003F5BA288